MARTTGHLEPAERDPAQLRRTGLAIAVVMLIGGVLVTMAYRIKHREDEQDSRPHVVQRLTEVFFGRDQNNKAFSTEQLKGRITLFTPLSLREEERMMESLKAMKEVALKFPEDEKLCFLGITVDPEQDNPELLKAALEKLGVGGDERWFFVQAEEEAARLATVKLLLHHGANLEARDRYGHRAHQIAHMGSSARALLNDVRAAGGWRPYARRGFHGDRLEMLVLRVLCERGRARTDDALLSRLFPCVESARASDDEVVEAPARRLDPVDRDAFRHVFSFWPPLSRVIGGQAEDELDAASVKRMTLPKLKAALSERGLDATAPKGSVKATLRERLLGFIESSPW